MLGLSVKIVIRGDRNTGKSTLWHRLQGKKFQEEYIPTQEIQVTSIHWSYKSKLDVFFMQIKASAILVLLKSLYLHS